MAEEEKEQEQKEEAKTEEEKAAPEKPLNKMTAKELREVALGIDGITGVHAMKKDELLAAIKEAKGIKDEEPAKKKKKLEKATLSVKELKEKIRMLQQEKKAARDAKDKVKIDVLRRRINRLKKRTRKAARA